MKRYKKSLVVDKVIDSDESISNKIIEWSIWIYILYVIYVYRGKLINVKYGYFIMWWFMNI